METNTAASDYISLYQGEKEVLAASLGRVQRTAARIIEGVMAEERHAVAMTGEAAVLAAKEAA